MKHEKGTVSLQSPENTRFDKMCPTNLLIILECDVYSVLVGYLIPQDETVNTQHYKSVLCYHLHHTVKENHPGLGQNAIIIPDNAAAHSPGTV
jgi:hypothetical protein